MCSFIVVLVKQTALQNHKTRFNVVLEMYQVLIFYQWSYLLCILHKNVVFAVAGKAILGEAVI